MSSMYSPTPSFEQRLTHLQPFAAHLALSTGVVPVVLAAWHVGSHVTRCPLL